MYVTEDKFYKFDILDSIPKEVVKIAKENNLLVFKDKVKKWYRFTYQWLYIKEVDAASFSVLDKDEEVTFVTNQEFINIIRGVKNKKHDLKNLELIGLSNRFYKNDPELLYFLKRLETLGIYIDKDDIRYKDFKFIFYPKQNILAIEGNGRYQECNIWQYFTTEDFLKILESHILNMRDENIFNNIKIKQYKY